MNSRRLSSVAAGAALALAATAMTVVPASAAHAGDVHASAVKSADEAIAAGKKKKTKLKAKAPKVVTVHTGTYVTGKVNGPKRKLTLQLKNAYGWANVDKAKSKKNGRYNLKVPSTWYGKKKLRVVVPAKGKFGKKQKTLSVRVNPDYTPVGSKGAWSNLSAGRKTRYNPCQAVTYKYNATGLPADGVAVTQEAIFRISMASGLRYKAKGTTSAVPFQNATRAYDKKANLTIAWSHPGQVTYLAGGVLAVGGYMQAAYVPKRKTYKLLKTGLVMDSTDDWYYAQYGRGFESGASMGAVIMHELTHAVGMGHTNDSTQIMYPQANPDKAALFGNGDINGLSKHGRDAGCLSGSRNAISAITDEFVFAPEKWY